MGPRYDQKTAYESELDSQLQLKRESLEYPAEMPAGIRGLEIYENVILLAYQLYPFNRKCLQAFDHEGIAKDTQAGIPGLRSY
jgi:hypothetical protein